MKTKITFYIIILFCTICSITSCNINQESYKSAPKSKDVLFSEAKEMKGIEKFIIGKTSIKDIKGFNADIKKDKRYGEFYLGEWMGEAFKEKDSWTSCSRVKQYSISKYFIGEIEIQYLDLYFYDGILYEIHSWTSGSIEEAFTKKYGEGIKDHYRYESGSQEKINIKDHTYITWENENVICHFNDSFEAINGKPKSRINNFIISTKDMSIHKSIKDCCDSEFERKKNEEEKAKNESINKI